ncbi:conserved protein of unknown function (plasmid) [Rhodovastum atsumiense]|uniref:Uncharacterized protein n=1 Tax=Rhodovastum atsumiense TaxID=504468 RepID=A0A5M6ITH6_9PROT|nr:DUF2157 domain-containing protein [Rhodovastum atsumiense]KAA5611614.1 hypothetical protein F1189_13715 [Rhodovastum atsumiense]CAH2606299.1 conserved protein of unknown function [Rhodovastum atsumiense]
MQLNIALLLFAIVLFGLLIWLMAQILPSTEEKPESAPPKISPRSNKPIRPRSVEEQLRDEIAAVHNKLAFLQGEHDRWKERAKALATRVCELESAHAESIKTDSGDRSQYRRLRSLIATEFHPDHIKVEGIEKIVRTEIFKAIWPKVQDIEKTH